MNTTPDNSGDGAAQAQPIAVVTQYIKDLSFEAPGMPGVLATLRGKAPDIAVGVDVQAKPIEGQTFEVALHFKVDCKVGGAVAFILELVYAGLFTLNVQPDHVHPVLLIECPRLLFPFARNIINDISRDGGFPPLLLGPIDFVSMYQNQLEALRRQAEAKSDTAGTA